MTKGIVMGAKYPLIPLLVLVMCSDLIAPALSSPNENGDWIRTDQKLYWISDPSPEPARILLHNAGDAVLDGRLSLRVQMWEEGAWTHVWGFDLVILPRWEPGFTTSWTWNQQNGEGEQVPPGEYRALWTPYANKSPVGTFSTGFRIEAVPPRPDSIISFFKRCYGVDPGRAPEVEMLEEVLGRPGFSSGGGLAPMLYLGGPFSNPTSAGACSSACVSFGRDEMVINGTRYSSSWSRWDFGLIYLFQGDVYVRGTHVVQGDLFVMGTHRYGTRAGLLYALRVRPEARVVLVRWDDLNGDKEVQFEEISEVWSLP